MTLYEALRAEETPAMIDEQRRFLAFAKTKPVDESYDYMDIDACPLAQYGQHVTGKACLAGSHFYLIRGIKVDEAVAVFSYNHDSKKRIFVLASDKEHSKSKYWTWGKLVERLEKVLNEELEAA